ncbi:MAG: T9SS type A sorting domain-containing protein, partial [Tannerella sp.]|nr:T9SS type A sorting domain-containing protein [Tannerella sp.]
RSSASRLLVIGREDGNSLSEGEYLFWGDNGAATAPDAAPWIEGLKRMDRQWLVKTNILPVPQPVAWETENLELSVSGFVSTVTKAGGSAPNQGTAVTGQPLSGSSGYLCISDFTFTGGLTVRFGAQSAAYTSGSHDYGYFIDSDYKVYKIERGVKQSDSFTLLILAGTLEVEKTAGSLFLRVNGTRLAESEIGISPQDRNQSFYGAVAVTKSLVNTRFTLREGGFGDTGQRVELSYACAPGFESQGKEKGVLVIDRSGSGEFQPSDLEFILADETDLLRQKVIFHNVFFDRDGNGTDVFTFAYGNPDVLGNLQIIPPGCEESNGEFILKLDWGIRGYNYSLTDSATGTPVRNSWEGSRQIHVTGLPAGSYKLSVTEAGGYTFESTAPVGASVRAKTTNFLPVFEGTIPWTVSSIGHTYGIGYTTSSEEITATGNIIHYGLKQAGDKLYKLEGSKQTLLNTTVSVGDRLRISKAMSKVTYYQNDIEIGASNIGILDYLLKFYGLLDFSSGSAEVLNVDAAGFFNLVDYRWETTEGVTALKSGNASKQYEIILPGGCDPNGGQALFPVFSETGSDRLRTGVIPGTLTLQAELSLALPSPVCFLVYDLKGRLIDRKEISTPQSVARAELTLPAPGFYIVKVITEEEEYTRKTVVR